MDRAVPTPSDVARARCGAPAAAPGLVAPAAAGAYDRHVWERAVLAAGDLPPTAHRVAQALARLADDTGHIPAGTAYSSLLAEATHISRKRVRVALIELGLGGWISRPDIDAWRLSHPRTVRPITLTLPGARGALPSTGEVPE